MYNKDNAIEQIIGGSGMAQMKMLNEMKPGEKGKVTKIAGSGSIYRRILDMGVVKGVEVEMERVAPLGDPVEVRIRNYHLALRKNEAANIYVEVTE